MLKATAAAYAVMLATLVACVAAGIFPTFETLVTAPVLVGYGALFLYLHKNRKGTSMNSEEEKPVSVFESEEWFGVFTNIDEGIPLLVAPSIPTVRHLYLQQHAKEEGVTLEQAEDSIRGLEASGYIFFAPVSVTVRFQKP